VTFNIDYINYNFILLIVKKIQSSKDRAFIRVIDIYQKKHRNHIFFYIDFKPLYRFFQISPKCPRKMILFNSKYYLRSKILIKRIKIRITKP